MIAGTTNKAPTTPIAKLDDEVTVAAGADEEAEEAAVAKVRFRIAARANMMYCVGKQKSIT